jgi:hypothetical protein
LGRVLVDDGWLSPIAQLRENEDHKLFWVPNEGTYVVMADGEFYIAGEAKLEDQTSSP